jgi:putative ABC transport system permease protein
MDLLRKLVQGIRALFRKEQLRQELDEELRSFTEAAVEHKIRAGLAREDALRAARTEIGSSAAIQDQVHDAGWESVVEDIWQDVRYGLRFLRRSPGFLSVAVLTLALGIGANTAIFSIVNAVLLRSLPFREPDRLVKIFFNNPGIGVYNVRFSVPELNDLRDRAGVFEYVSAAGRGSIDLTGGSQAERLELLITSPTYFSVLGAVPEKGRLFGPQDAIPGCAPVVVISDSLWRRNFAADPNIVGRAIHLDNDPYIIAGVLPPGFRHPGKTNSLRLQNVDVWQACGFSAPPDPAPTRSARMLPQAYGLLKRGVAIEEAQQRLTAMAADVRRDYPTDYPANAQWTVEIQPLQEALVGNVRPMLLLLQGAVILIVCIVALNLANLLLARASGRQQEMAVRSALGASRGRIVRQMLTESLVLSLIGGAAGIALAAIAVRFIPHLIRSSMPWIGEVGLDWRVLVYAMLMSLLTGLLFGLAPVIQWRKSDVSTEIRVGARGAGAGAKTGRLRDALIVSELGLAVVLLIGAGLLLRTLTGLLQENPGFNPTQVVAAHVNLPYPLNTEDRYHTIAMQSSFYRELLSRTRTIPGVELAGIVSDLPTSGNPFNFALSIEDRPTKSQDDLRVGLILTSPDYFKVMRASLLRGRYFSESDEDGKLPVAIIDEATARRYWPAGDALGRRVKVGQDPAWKTIVGIIQNIKHDGLDRDGIPHIYTPVYQRFDAALGLPFRDFAIVLRTSLPASTLEPLIRHHVASIDPALPVYSVSSMEQVLDNSLASRRFSAELVGSFAALAILLASIGIYGLLAYMVGQRSREIGVRMALGATPAGVVRLFLKKGVILAAIGIAAGTILSASTASLMAAVLYGVRPHDPWVFLVAPLLLLAVAVLASYLPARRATKVDVMSALRDA